MCGSKETDIEQNPQMIRMHKLQYYKMILSRSHDDLNMIDDNVELIESFSASIEMHNAFVRILNICF
jgi:hypothetical protein